jgi:hypothetical protein
LLDTFIHYANLSRYPGHFLRESYHLSINQTHFIKHARLFLCSYLFYKRGAVMDFCVYGRRGKSFQIIILPLVVALFGLLFSSCGQSNTTASPPGAAASPTAVATPTMLSPTPVPTPTPTANVALQGPTNFVLNKTLTFSQAAGNGIVNGVTTPLSSDVVRRGVISTFQRTLFVVDSNNHISVYTDGSTKPLAAQSSTGADGSSSISYTHTLSTGSTTFNGTLRGNQMAATYTTDSMSGTTVDGQNFSGGTNTTSTFTTQVQWVSTDQIPAVPVNGHYQLTSDGGVALTWSPGTAGGAVTGYDVYRFVLTDPQGMQFLTKTTSPAYTDESQVARSNAQTITGMAYMIYAVGTSGIENPGCVTIPVASSISIP